MSSLALSLIGALAISSISLVGIVILILKDKFLNKILFSLVSFSTGALLGGAFFHLLPEALEEFNNPIRIFEFTLIGFATFFIFERILRWHHCHNMECNEKHHLGQLTLVGDGIHNLIDGLIIFGAFSVSPALGWPVLISLALHEIPQEIGDYGLLIYAGYGKAKALFYNFISALTAILGVLLGFLLNNEVANINNFILPFAAGGFIYIAASDLIPELHKETNTKKSIISFIIFALAVIFMLFLAKQ